MSGAPVGILLAAGRSRRFHGNKLLHRLDDRTPMVLASARRLRSALARTLVVIGQHSDELAALLAAEGFELVVNPGAEAGMGTSIARGVAASRDAEGWLVALGDMPYVSSTVVAQLAGALAAGADLVAPSYGRRRGHPVGFCARHAPALLRLDDDKGARDILRANATTLKLLETHDVGVVTDIDTRWQCETLSRWGALG